MTWEVLESLLNAPPSTTPTDAACRAAGLPILAQATDTFQQSYDLLKSVGIFVANNGLADAIDQMKTTIAAQQHGLATSFDALQNHLASSLFSPTLLQTAPSRYFRVPPPVPSWYDTLNTTAIAEILAELDQGPRPDRLVLACTNGLPNANPIRRGPFVTASFVELHASTSSGTPLPPATFSRKVDRVPATAILASSTDPSRATDATPPTHRKPIKYKIEAPNYRAGTVDAIVVEHFGCSGLVVARDAERK